MMHGQKNIKLIFCARFVWVRNSVAHIEGGTKAESVWEQGAKEDIWA